MKPKIILCLALVLSCGLCGCFSSVRAGESATNAEPRYLDKSLSEWIPLAKLEGELFIPRDKRAADAVCQIGTNAIPWLLQSLRSDDPNTARLGIEGFYLLGPIAKPALPNLIRMAYDWETSTAWSNAIPALAPLADTDGYAYAIPWLLPLSTNQAAPPDVRRQAVWSITQAGYYNLGTNASWAIAAFIVCLQDKDWRVATAAADALGHYTLEPKLAIPALAACLMSRTNALVPSAADDDPYHWHGDVSVRSSAASALCAFASNIYYAPRWGRWPKPQYTLAELREAMSAAVPALVKALEDPDYRVTRDAATALGYAAIEPDIVVPALVKSLDYPQDQKRFNLIGVRHAAINALGDFGEAAQAAVPALTKIAQSDPDGYVGGSSAASALKNITSPKK
jgi:HEAT repeat protein